MIGRNVNFDIKLCPHCLRTNLEAKLFSKVVKTEECWNWVGSINVFGYGIVGLLGKRYYTHRLSYELAKGPIPNGLDIDHLCRNRACVNPKHLEPVTRNENVRRGILARKVGRTREFCKNDHRLTPDNLHIRKKARGIEMQCLQCRYEKNHRRPNAEWNEYMKWYWAKERMVEASILQALDIDDFTSWTFTEGKRKWWHGWPMKTFADGKVQCPKCSSIRILKDGTKKGRQAYVCGNCEYAFVGQTAFPSSGSTPKYVTSNFISAQVLQELVRI